MPEGFRYHQAPQAPSSSIGTSAFGRNRMKLCDRCNTTYPDNVTVCPKDRSTLRTVAGGPAGFQAAEHVTSAIDGHLADSDSASGLLAVHVPTAEPQAEPEVPLPAEAPPSPAATGLVLGAQVSTTATGSLYRGTHGKKPVAVRLVKVEGRLLGREQMI